MISVHALNRQLDHSKATTAGKRKATGQRATKPIGACRAAFLSPSVMLAKRLFYGHLQLPLSTPNSQRLRLI